MTIFLRSGLLTDLFTTCEEDAGNTRRTCVACFFTPEFDLHAHAINFFLYKYTYLFVFFNKNVYICQRNFKNYINMSLKVNVINKSKHRLPEYATVGSAGMDLKADINEPYILEAKNSIIIPTGLYVALPEGYEATIRSRSGLAFKYDIVAFHGLIDSDYRGEIRVKLFNLSDNNFVINPGERIAQLKVATYENVEWNEVHELESTERGEGGFGHTGTN